MSVSIEVTPASSAASKLGKVFSGLSPRAPRWPCRSKRFIAGKLGRKKNLAEQPSGHPARPEQRRGRPEKRSCVRTAFLKVIFADRCLLSSIFSFFCHRALATIIFAFQDEWPRFLVERSQELRV